MTRCLRRGRVDKTNRDEKLNVILENFDNMSLQQQLMFLGHVEEIVNNPFMVTDEELEKRVRMGKEAQVVLDSRRNA